MLSALSRSRVLLTAVSGVLLACAPDAAPGSTRLLQPLDAESCGPQRPCEPGFVCVEAAAGPDANRCEQPKALYSFLQIDTTDDGLLRALDQVMGDWRTERALTPLAVQTHPMTLLSGERVVCFDADDAAPRDCWVPAWAQYFRPTSIADKYDRFALFGLRGLRFLMSGWRSASDAELAVAGALRGLRMSADTMRLNFRNTLLAAIDAFTREAQLPYALPNDPAPNSSVGWLNPNGAFDVGMALWDPGSNANCKTAKTGALVPGFTDLYYYDLRASVWDRHASSFRAMTLINAYFQLRGLLTPEQRELWFEALRQIGDELALSASFEPGQNHGISEAGALLQLGSEFVGQSPALVPDSATLEASWRDLAASRLNDVIGDTMLPDGAQNEFSLFYHNYELSFLMDIERFLERHPEIDLARVSGNAYDRARCADGSQFDHHVEPSGALSLANVLAAGVRVSVHTSMPNTEIPALGSSPQANLIEYFDTPYEDYVASHPGRTSAELDFVRSLGARGTAPLGRDRMQVFESSGYVTLRSAFVPRTAAQTHVLFNTAPPGHAHAHLDALSVHVYAQNNGTPTLDDGLPLLIDSGWFSYSNEQRHYFESTTAHDTINVDGRNQCSYDPSDKRADPSDPVSVLASCVTLPTVAERSPGWPAGRSLRGASLRDLDGTTRVLYQSAEAGLYPNVSHRRGVALLGRDIVLVLDQIVSGDGAHRFEQNFHVSPAVANVVSEHSAQTAHYRFVDASGTSLFSGHFSDLTRSEFALHKGGCASCDSDLCAGVGCTQPNRGWFSPAENVKVPIWSVARSSTSADVTWASLFLFGDLSNDTPELTLTSGPNADDHELAFRLGDGMALRLGVQNFAAASEHVTISYPLGAVLASYSFEGEPSTTRDLNEGLGVSVTVPGETSGSVSAVPGVVGRAYRYDSGATLLGSSNSFAFMHKPRAAVSLSFWLRMNSANLGASGGQQAIFSTSSWSSAGTGVELYFQDDASRNNALRFVVRGNGGTPLSFGANDAVPEDTSWHHYVLSFDSLAASAQVHLYRDGLERAAGGVASALSTQPPDAAAVIGKKPGTGVAAPLHAALDEFVIFKRVLTAADVQALYNAGNGIRAH